MESNPSLEYQFFSDFVSLCRQYGLAIRSDDPYECLVVVPFSEMEREYNLYLKLVHGPQSI